MATIRGMKASAKRVKIRNTVFGDPGDMIYDPGTSKGWRVVPRTLPLIMTLIRDLAPKGKGDGSARVYFELWMRDFGEGYVELSDDDVHAFASGYTNGRSGVRSWRDCMKVLTELAFIKIEPRGSREYGYALLFDPDKIVSVLVETQPERVSKAWLTAYRRRQIEIGAV